MRWLNLITPISHCSRCALSSAARWRCSAGLAILGFRAGAGGDTAGGGRAQRHRLPNIARSFGPAISFGIVVATAEHPSPRLRPMRCCLSSPIGRAVHVEPGQRTFDCRASTKPRHRLGRALHHEFALDQDRWQPPLVTGLIGGSISAPDAAGRARPAAWRRADHGIMLGAFRMGAVISALNIGHVQRT